MLKVLAEFGFPVTELIPIASARSVGGQVRFKGESIPVVDVEAGLAKRPAVALFSAGSEASKAFAPAFVEAGAYVIDNSSAWRMDPAVPLVVPEINLDAVRESKLIANPNCSTIQMVMVLAPILEHYGIRRVVVSTYQSVSGTGKAAMEQLESEARARYGLDAGVESGFKPNSEDLAGAGGQSDHAAGDGKTGDGYVQVYPKQIYGNTLPHCDIFLENDYTKEEMKLVHESRKILGVPDLRVTATAVRVPVAIGHGEAVNVETEREFDVAVLKGQLSEMRGVVVMDHPAAEVYPTALEVAGQDAVFVGRIRRDESLEHGLNLWIVADNLRKGAATNAVQIANGLLERGLVKAV